MAGQRAGEELQRQLAEEVAARQRERGGETARVEQLERQVVALEARGSATARALAEREEEVARVEREFEGYKLRAQSVLKQSREAQGEQEEARRRQEVTAVEQLNDALNDKLKSLSLEVGGVQGVLVGAADDVCSDDDDDDDDES